jgi:hypothetical protein
LNGEIANFKLKIFNLKLRAQNPASSPLEAEILRRIRELAVRRQMPTAILLDDKTAGNAGIAVRIGGAENKNHTCDAAHTASDTGAHDAVLLSKM